MAERSGFRYPSDLTDAEWAISCAPYPASSATAGGDRSVNVREVLNGIFCQWKAPPKDLPPNALRDAWIGASFYLGTAGIPHTLELLGTSRLTSDIAPITTRSPMVMPFCMTDCGPI